MHKKLRSLLLVFFAAPSVGQAQLIHNVCTPYKVGDEFVSREARVIESWQEVHSKAERAYQSPARLRNRAYWDSRTAQILIPYQNSVIALPDRVIHGLTRQVSVALDRKYADAVIYADMGHAHLLVNKADFETGRSISSPQRKVEHYLSSPSLTALYHTAEMIKLKEGDTLKGDYPQDTWKLWRYFSRNLVSTFHQPDQVDVIWAGPTALYNTVRSLPQMVQVDTLYFSAQKDACFKYETQEGRKYFDISFETLPYR